MPPKLTENHNRVSNRYQKLHSQFDVDNRTFEELIWNTGRFQAKRLKMGSRRFLDTSSAEEQGEWGGGELEAMERLSSSEHREPDLDESFESERTMGALPLLMLK